MQKTKTTLIALTAVAVPLAVLNPLMVEAASRITGRDIKNGTVTSADLKNGTVTGADTRNGTLTGADVKDGTLTTGDIKNGTVGTSDIKDGEIGEEDLRPGVIPTVPAPVTHTATLDDTGFVSESWKAGIFTVRADCLSAAPGGNEGLRDYLWVSTPGGENWQVVSPLDGSAMSEGTAGPVWYFAPGTDTATVQILHPSSGAGLTLVASRLREGGLCQMVVTSTATPAAN